MVCRAVFLDRDGVLNIPTINNGRSYAPRKLDDFQLYTEAVSSLGKLRQAGFSLIVVTNQPDVGNGLVDSAVVESMHQKLCILLPIDAVKVCFHSQMDDCYCRKPKPGMLLDAAREFNINLTASFLIGDRWSDVEAGRQCGCFTIFIDRGYHEKKPNLSDATVYSLTEACEVILSRA